MSNPQGHDQTPCEFIDNLVDGLNTPENDKIVRAVFGTPPNETTVTIRERKDEPGKRFDAGKLRFDLIPADWETTLAEVLTRGSLKYSERNWEKGMSWSRCYAAVRRHLNAFWRGEDLDKESGLNHLAHVAWGALAILHYYKTHPELDDRVKEDVK